jgi:hypothetical protein
MSHFLGKPEFVILADALTRQAPWRHRGAPMALKLPKILETIDFLSCLMYPNSICNNFS